MCDRFDVVVKGTPYSVYVVYPDGCGFVPSIFSVEEVVNGETYESVKPTHPHYGKIVRAVWKEVTAEERELQKVSRSGEDVPE